MSSTTLLLAVILVILFMIYSQLADIRKRLRERFPTEKEQDSDWALKDAMGHWEAHKGDK
jgi:predicted PurR-regulated permease PerM